MPVALVCENCGKPFVRKPSEVGAYCSRSCAYMGISARARTVATAIQVTLACESCGESFVRRPSEVGAYCSRSCTYTGKSIRARARRVEPEPPPVEGARWIALNRGFALVDADRFEELNAFVWSTSSRDGNYAARFVDGKTIPLHHAVLGVPGHIRIDHKNGNTRDCRKENLRIADNSLNGANIGKRVGPHSSVYKGVVWDRSREEWAARLGVRGKRLHLGRYPTEHEAAVAYDAAAIQHFGEFARTNFLRSQAS